MSMTGLSFSSRNIDSIENGSLLIIGHSVEMPILFVRHPIAGMYGFSLTFGSAWYLPGEDVKYIHTNIQVKSDWLRKAEDYLCNLHTTNWFSNLDYVEALAKLKEYETH